MELLTDPVTITVTEGESTEIAPIEISNMKLVSDKVSVTIDDEAKPSMEQVFYVYAATGRLDVTWMDPDGGVLDRKQFDLVYGEPVTIRQSDNGVKGYVGYVNDGPDSYVACIDAKGNVMPESITFRYAFDTCYCTHCGAVIEVDAVHCSYCGTANPDAITNAGEPY